MFLRLGGGTVPLPAGPSFSSMISTLFCAEEVSVNPHRVDSVSAHPFKSLALRQRFEQSGLFDHFVVELRGAP